MAIYVVQAGDSVDTIAQNTGVAVEDIIFANQLLYPYRLALGQALWLPEEQNEPEFGRTINTNGYAYPFIDEYVLAQSLPYLSSLSIFSYGFTPQGELVPPSFWSDEPLIAAALAAHTRPVLTLTPFGPDGMFNNNLISQVLADDAARTRLNTEIVSVMQAKGYLGLDVDFEYIYAEDRDSFTAWVGELAEAMHANGFTISVAVAPKTYAGQPGLLYEGQDYAALGALVDYVLVMTYEWGYTYSEPMPIAPLNWVRRVVEYAVTEIPAEKIDLGIANYAYDWTLPYVKGETAARSFGIVEAMQQAAEVGAEIMFDEEAYSPYYNYTAGGVEHEVWFEDVRSLSGKLALIDEFGLHGGGWWQIMRLFRAGWLTLVSKFSVAKGDF
ncbi:MAG TPA: LysM peptidoglycan-binding domain-containing protein [Candidatus Avidehalobacter gallistercoris]|uniref:LysM peptidoglycan-binding domain-containing protein n=1 Tax=Candidatus Avidehalobacter gallistercoris TaxID=2840694 RepID=A0A9D1HIQ8_9FIRM|nr:LysM peptidoglycan-binding domain-containing protein [Candidatus Avidehalobacter gallistercoris]